MEKQFGIRALCHSCLPMGSTRCSRGSMFPRFDVPRFRIISMVGDDFEVRYSQGSMFPAMCVLMCPSWEDRTTWEQWTLPWEHWHSPLHLIPKWTSHKSKDRRHRLEIFCVFNIWKIWHDRVLPKQFRPVHRFDEHMAGNWPPTRARCKTWSIMGGGILPS